MVKVKVKVNLKVKEERKIMTSHNNQVRKRKVLLMILV
jgi:hypothetical protein